MSLNREYNLFTKDGLINALIASGRLYLDAKFSTIQVAHGTTVGLFTPQDLCHVYKDHYQEKLRDAVHYQGSLADYDVLDAFKQFLPAGEKLQVEKCVTAFLHIADRVSARGNSKGKSFLRAARDNNFEYDPDTKCPKFRSKEELKQNLINTLIDLEIYDGDMVGFVQEWCSGQGNVTICGQPQFAPAGKEDEFTEGNYAQLARRICGMKNSIYYLISDCISFALGNKKRLADGKFTPEQCYNHIGILLKNDNFIEEVVESGTDIRIKRLDEAVRERFAGIDPQPLSTEQEKVIRHVLEELAPDDKEEELKFLKILYYSGYSVDLIDHVKTRGFYPDENLPGNSHDVSESFREGAGARLSRFKMIFAAYGLRKELLTPESYAKAMAQTLAHELIHCAFNDELVIHNEDLFCGLNEKGAFDLSKQGLVYQQKNGNVDFFASLEDHEIAILEQHQSLNIVVVEGDNVRFASMREILDARCTVLHGNYSFDDNGICFPNDAKEEVECNKGSLALVEPHLFSILPKLQIEAEKAHKAIAEIADHLERHHSPIKAALRNQEGFVSRFHDEQTGRGNFRAA